MIDDEIKEIVEGCYSNSKRILVDHMEILKDLSDTLLERETLTGEEVDLLVKGEELPPRVVPSKPMGYPPKPETPPARFHSAGNSRVLSLKRVVMNLPLNGKPLIMGILNITPDSFSDGGHFLSSQSALEQARRMVSEGADILDIGGESTRPFSEPVSLEDEMERILPVIRVLAGEISVPISVDTYKSEIARAALDAGASIVNDISALSFDSNMGRLAAERDVPVILMHMKGRPKDMQVDPHYDDVIAEIKEFFRERMSFAERQGVKRERIIPGSGHRLRKNGEPQPGNHPETGRVPLPGSSHSGRLIKEGLHRKNTGQGTFGTGGRNQRNRGPLRV